MPLSQRGNGNRLGTRTKKKHKKLDAICEDVFNQNRRVRIESNEGTSSKGESSMGNDSELRRSSRMRRAPVVLDASPPPPKKRRKLDKLGKKVCTGSREKLRRGKGKVVKNEATPSSFSRNSLEEDEEELGAWRSRLRSRVKSVRFSLKGNGVQQRRKRKLFQDPEEDEDDGEMKSNKDDLMGKMACVDGEKSRVVKSRRPGRVRALIDCEDELDDDRVADESLEKGFDALRNIDGGDHIPSTSGGNDRDEEIMDGSPVSLVEKESDVPSAILVEEKQDWKDNMTDTEQNDELLNSSKLVEDTENQGHDEEVGTLRDDLVEDEGYNDVDKVAFAETEVKHAGLEYDAQKRKTRVAASGFPRPRIKEGRRCGLCGGGTDGKPPKRLANDSAGSDHETYSGSSASEECNYDPWDGFGDESGWLGRLLGPINDRYGIAGIWVHQHCAVWSPEVYFAGLGCLKNVRAALCRGRALKCTRCGRPGATLGCRVDRCPRTYHLPCARASGCIFDHRKFLIACADHRYLFEPHGNHYLQRMKKLKAKKMKLEIRKQSNDASRKDLEAEEKWMEKCGEDEEFLRRETKRLQRDLLRIAPVYIGGPQSEGENVFEGWESVAGLQDVIRCMKEVVILPLLYPEFFENMGITPPRGVLLHGYPGTGKTLVVRALIGSCARGDKRIAYFARKGADCLGKYVGDAERQLRLLFQVAERSQPSIIFFDEIDGLAPVRTRQQDQTHSSVVSTLLALMDGLKSRGSVIVIGATNRPDAIDPALRRPGRFDREVYFPLPTVKDRASILALHTIKWPKPLAGPLLEWVATKTVGFAGADLQALCAQAAVIGLKRNCSWQQILSSAGGNCVEGKRPQLPAFSVEERDWLEALSLAPPPCSRREAGIAANEVMGSPLHMHLIPCLLQPLLSLIISLFLDDRLWLPRRLVNAGAAIRNAVEKKNLRGDDRWWCHAHDMVREPDAEREIVRSLSIAGILDGDASFDERDLSADTSLDDSEFCPCSLDANPSGLLRNACYVPSKKAGYRILIAGDPKSGQKHLASCLLHCFVGSIEMQKVDLATISQEGHGNLEEGISRILMKCSSVKMCAVFMPRIDLWAIQPHIQSAEEDGEASSNSQSSKESSSASCLIDGEECSTQPKSELVGETQTEDEFWNASQTWKSFREQLECICVSSSLIIMATSELPFATLPLEVRQFFASEPLASEAPIFSEHAIPRFTVEVDGKFDRDLLIITSASNLSRDLTQQFVHLVRQRNHAHSSSSITSEARYEDKSGDLLLSHETDSKSADEEPGARKQLSEGPVTKIPFPSVSRNLKGKSTLVMAIGTLGYQILRYPHFAELCWVTSKLKEGPTADIHGPWKGWPFNSCIVRPCKSIQKETGGLNSNNSTKGKDKFTLVRGLVAVALSAYKGIYTSPTEVSLEVRKVLELLVAEIGARIQSGKDRYQFIRLLSQVAYLDDMVYNWSHSLKSLEADVPTRMNPEHSGPECADNPQIPTDNPAQVEEPNTLASGFQEPELVEGDVQKPNTKAVGVAGGNLVELPNPHESSPNKVIFSDVIAPDIHLPGEVASQEKGSPKPQVSCTEYLDQSNTATCNSGKLHNVELCGPHDKRCQSNTEPVVQNEVSAKVGTHIGDVCIPDLNLPSEMTTDDLSSSSSKSEVVCSYSCCIGCINSLRHLVEKMLTRELELSGSHSTLEDAHDLVSSLSSSLCSSIINFYVTGGSTTPFNIEPRSESYRKLVNGCQCESSEDKFTMLRECVCHQGKDNQPAGLSPRYIFRDGVLVTAADHDKEVSFHCKYDTLCLCSLIELIVTMKQPLD